MYRKTLNPTDSVKNFSGERDEVLKNIADFKADVESKGHTVIYSEHFSMIDPLGAPTTVGNVYYREAQIV